MIQSAGLDPRRSADEVSSHPVNHPSNRPTLGPRPLGGWHCARTANRPCAQSSMVGPRDPEEAVRHTRA